ncbi:MAG: hypothetical protein JWN44_4096 [Myxococcales bacterium]|nr:hypothetical protein [Myxococcales bacterium]
MTAVGRPLSAISLSITVAITVALSVGGCANTAGSTKGQRTYAKSHTLSTDEKGRMYSREGKRGDTLDRLRMVFDDCEFARRALDGDLSVWMVHVPVGSRAIRLDTDKLEEVGPGGTALLTLDHDRLKTAVVLE